MKEKTPPGIKRYTEDFLTISKMTNEEKGELLSGMIEYAQTGRRLELSERVDFVLDMFLQKIDREKIAYQKTCLRNAYIAGTRKHSLSREDWLRNNPKTVKPYSEEIISNFLNEEKDD